MGNLQDIPKHAPYFFIDPDLSSPDADIMVKKYTTEQQGDLIDFLTRMRDNILTCASTTAQVLQAVTARLRKVPEPWDGADFASELHAVRADLGVPSKMLMTVVRHALCGMKVRRQIPPA